MIESPICQKRSFHETDLYYRKQDLSGEEQSRDKVALLKALLVRKRSIKRQTCVVESSIFQKKSDQETELQGGKLDLSEVELS